MGISPEEEATRLLSLIFLSGFLAKQGEAQNHLGNVKTTSKKQTFNQNKIKASLKIDFLQIVTRHLF